MTNRMQLKLNCDLPPKKKGDVISVECDEYGVPLEHYWRNRLKDSAIDNCVEVVNAAPAENETKKAKA